MTIRGKCKKEKKRDIRPQMDQLSDTLMSQRTDDWWTILEHRFLNLTEHIQISIVEKFKPLIKFIVEQKTPLLKFMAVGRSQLDHYNQSSYAFVPQLKPNSNAYLGCKLISFPNGCRVLKTGQCI